MEEIDIDFEKILEFARKNEKKLIYIILAILIVFGFYSRIGNIKNMKSEYLISPDDPYIFLRYSKYISEGKLPENDRLRYYPIGHNPKRENLFTAYLAGYIHKIAKAINPSVNMFDIGAWYAPFLLTLSLIAMFFLSKEILGEKIALISTGILAFSPAILFRTAGGFLEKEPLFLLMFLISTYFIVKMLKSEKTKEKMIMSVLAGIFTGLSGFASGLYFFIIMFFSGYLILEIILNKMNKDEVFGFGIWLLLFYLTISLLTKKYGGFTSFYRNIQFQIPISAFVIGCVYLLIKRFNFKRFNLFKGIISIGIGALLIIISGIPIFGASYVFDKIIDLKELVETPMTRTRFGQSVSENQPPVFIGGGSSWWNIFGITIGYGNFFVSIGLTFLMFFIGAILLFYEEFKNLKYGKIATVGFFLFSSALTFEHFTNNPMYRWVNFIFSFQYFYGLIFIFGLVLILLKNSIDEIKKIDSVKLFLIIMYLVSIVAANGAIRLFFIMALPASLIAGYFVKWTSNQLKEKNKLIPYALALIVIVPNFVAATNYVSQINPSASMKLWYEAIDWIKENTPKDAIITHWWDYGYLIQAMANRTTVGDPGNAHVVRNYDIGGHVFNAFNYSEILWFTDKYNLTDKDVYLVIPSEDILKFVQISRLGSLSNGTSGRETFFTIYGITNTGIIPNNLKGYEKYSHLIVFNPLTGESPVLRDFRIGKDVYEGDKTYILRYLQPVSENETGPILVQILNLRYQKIRIMPVKCVCYNKCIDVKEDGVPTCALIIKGGIINIPYKSKDILFTQLYLLDRNISGFEKVYDNGLPLDINTARGAGPLIRIYKYNWSAIKELGGW